MPDNVILSLWLPRGEEFTLAPLEQALRLPPASALRPGVLGLTVTPLDWAQPPVMEEKLPDGADLAEAMEVLAEYLHADYAFEAERAWDLWSPDGRGGWARAACPLRARLAGPEFEREAVSAGRGGLEGAGQEAARPEGDLTVDCGPESLFFSGGPARAAASRTKLQANLAALMLYTHELSARLRATRRRLWSETSADLNARFSAEGQWVQ